MELGKQFLSDLKLYSDYLKWREEDKRFETWDEACENIVDGHRKKYENITGTDKELDFALSYMKSKTVLASQRSLQYRAPQIERNNARMYNCSSLYAARNRIFQEVFFLGLSGCGVGIGLLKPFVANLSKIQKRTKGTKTFFINDSIEEWSNALGVLMSSYFVDKQPFPQYAGYEIKFDYSLIREKGSFISGGFKAPGPDGLKQSLEKIETLIENWLNTEGEVIRPILVFDILCHSADAVLAGGVRRSALNMIVDSTDDEMIYAKTGNWRSTHPHRGRSNNSVLFLRKQTTKEEFEKIVRLNDGGSDIGFAFANSYFDMFNPCFEILKIPILFKGDLESITYQELPEFIKTHENLMGVQVCNLTEINAEACTTIDQFYKACRAATILGTVQAGYTSFPYLGEITQKIVEREALIGVSITGLMNNPSLLSKEILKEGARIVKETNKEIASLIGINQAARTSTIKPSGNASVVLGTASGIHPEHSERYFRIMQLNKENDTAKWLNENMPQLLEDSYWSNTNSDYVVYVPIQNPKEGLFKKDIKGVKHLEYIKLVQKYWVAEGTNRELCAYPNVNHNVSCFTKDTRFYTSEGILSFDDIKDLDSIKVLNKNFNFSESKIIDGGVQEIFEVVLSKNNLKKVIKTTANHNWTIIRSWDKTKNAKQFIKQTIELEPGMKIPICSYNSSCSFNLTAFLHGCVFGDGTLHKNNNKCQIYLFEEKVHLAEYFEKAGYKCIDREDHIRIYGLPENFKEFPETTDSNYIRSFISGWFNTDGYISEDGRTCSISNVYKSNLEWLQEKSCIGKIMVNEICETKIGKTSYSNKDFNYTISFNKESLDSLFFKNPKKLKRWVNYELNKTQGAKKWKIESVRKTGTFESVYCVNEPETNSFLLENNVLTNNCTVIVDHKQNVIDYIWDNKSDFTAVSFISDYGDKEFIQAPFTSVSSLSEIISTYGKGALFASGLIVDGLHYFNNNLWVACETIKDKSIPITGTREQVMLKKYWLDRAKKFANNFFDGDITQMIYCLKDVHLLHKWELVTRNFEEVDFGSILKKPVFKSVSDFAATACSGSQCEITRI